MAKEDKIEGFYISIQEEIDYTAKQDMLIITGDWNAKIVKQSQISLENLD